MMYPFIPAFYDFGPRPGPARAFVVHMAEGGGTVGYLAKAQPNRVSVHYVIERTGRIVQMLKEDRISGSINPNDLRTSNDTYPMPYPFGVTTAKAVLGDMWRDPNRAVISLEIEGFAATGPNGSQAGSLKTLVNDVRSRHPGMGLLGHRDFADYKACPGKLIPWTDIGGHGPASQEEPTLVITRTAFVGGQRVIRFMAGAKAAGYVPRNGVLVEVVPEREWPTDSSAHASYDAYIDGVKHYQMADGYYGQNGSTYVPASDLIVADPDPVVLTQRDMDLEYNAALGDAGNAVSALRRVVA
jgi:hypothetical protein